MPCSAFPRRAVAKGSGTLPLGGQAGLMEGPAAAGDSSDGGGNGGGGALDCWGGNGGHGGRRSGGSGGAAAAHGASSPEGGSAGGSGPAAGNARGLVATAGGVVVTVQGFIPVPGAARPWLPVRCSVGEKVPLTVYGRLSNGSVQPYNVTLSIIARNWRLSGIVPLVNAMNIYRGDRVRPTQEEVVTAGGMGVVVEKVAGQQQGQPGQGQQQQHRRRHVRTAVHIGTPKTVTVMLNWHVRSGHGPAI